MMWNQFLEFCAERNYKIDGSVSDEEIASILQDWGYNMRRKNGENYKQTVVKMIWNVAATMIKESTTQ